jgi:TATA-box binding protein (TBP) (component of TFIID and TFIIIB)
MATMSLTIDDEWENFLSPDYDCDEVDGENEVSSNMDGEIVSEMGLLIEPPKASEIYISTKSKIAYLNNEINLKDVFWKVPVIPYATPQNGVIKKQMKFNSLTQEELDGVQENLKHENHYEEQVITSINNPNGRIKFKDIRKISVGISKKDLMSYRCKKKSAFYNCFVMILRIKIDEAFKEFHIKVFNTGKLEIPGVQNDKIFETVLKNIINTLQPHVIEKLEYLQKSDTVLINSNFNCGFYINREALFDILKFKYNIQCIYDPCSYPGIQCKFYYNEDLTDQTGIQPTQNQDIVKDENGKKIKDKKIVEVSFMIFRTGSILIVGMCNENVLYIIYEYLKVLLTKEFHKINQKIITSENKISKDKKKKVRRKNIQISIQPQVA